MIWEKTSSQYFTISQVPSSLAQCIHVSLYDPIIILTRFTFNSECQTQSQTHWLTCTYTGSLIYTITIISFVLVYFNLGVIDSLYIRFSPREGNSKMRTRKIDRKIKMRPNWLIGHRKAR